MNNMHHHQQQQQKPRTPAELVADAERVVAALGAKRQGAAARAAEYAGARERLPYAAHVGLDVEAGRELAKARDAALVAERELAPGSRLDAAGATYNENVATYPVRYGCNENKYMLTIKAALFEQHDSNAFPVVEDDKILGSSASSTFCAFSRSPVVKWYLTMMN